MYGYGISGKQLYNFGDKKVNYFENGFISLINFDFKGDANKPYEELFSNYASILSSDLKGLSVMNYVSSHDDGWPFDKKREKAFDAGTKLLLTPGISQVYYGDETARSLEIEGAQGDATLRSFMNWEDLKTNENTKNVLTHFQKIGQFRKNHPAVGAGVHKEISKAPFYTFSRTFTKDDFTDKVVIGLELPFGKKEINVAGVFEDGSEVHDAFSGISTTVKDGKVVIDSQMGIVLLEKK